MKKWTDDFLARCLDGLPKDKYRKRAESELTDHLLELCADLESGGYSPEEAQARAVELMGKPLELKEHFHEQWKQRAEKLVFLLPVLIKSGGIGFLFRIFIRVFFIYPIWFFGAKLFDITIPNSIICVLFAIAGFWPSVPFIRAEIHRTFSLLDDRKKNRLTCYCCVLSWLSEFLLFVFLLATAFVGQSVISAAHASGNHMYCGNDFPFYGWFFFFSGQLPAFFFDRIHLVCYIVTSLLVCTFSSLLYFSRPAAGGELHELDN